MQAFRFKALLMLVFPALYAACAPAFSAQSVWNHNGSQMLLTSNGRERIITYYNPRPGISVQPGQVLFRGVRTGNSYSGTAYLFRRGCRPAPYHVRGHVQSEKQFVLFGRPPRRQGCQIIGYTSASANSVLAFTYIRTLYTAPPPVPEGPQSGPPEFLSRLIPGGKLVVRIQDEGDPAASPIRLDAHAECVSGNRVTVLKNNRTCAFDNMMDSPDGLSVILHQRDYDGATCSRPRAQRINISDLCR